ncbi:MAG TPA: threonine--tRNA ligase, partial [Candidatus Nanoarchaeia archaeon]|nr:threonine--tRNA ligase [Candidatus Nanoarchaeia archaeon]
EAEMQKIVKADYKLKRIEKSKKDSEALIKGNKFKLELLKDLKEGEVSFYEQGDFIDLCRGGHLESTGKVKAFKLLKIAGAYWRGDAKNPQLTRIYGTAWESDKELRVHLHNLQEAEKRNHVKIGEELKLFTHFELAGKGLPIWLPKGETVKMEVEKLAVETEEKAGYLRVSTPNIAKKELFIKSGHLPYYEESMYPAMVMDDGTYYLKAMNCPLHHLIYLHEQHSYRELPIRLAEFGTCYRNELSGTLTGLLRVRSLRMNDAHIYCRKDQVESEIENVLSMIKDYFKIFNLKDYWFRLSLHDPKNKKKYIDEPENWKLAEDALRKVLKKLGMKFIEKADEAAFYGPKIDIMFKNVFGREETMSTVQLDFAAKKRFELYYIDEKGSKNNEVFVIHRAPLSTHERFMAFLIEHYAGKFPLWLSPEQVRIMTITDRNIKFAEEICKKMKDSNIRVSLDISNETISKKVRDAQLEKVNYMITIGDKEVDNKTLAVRTREGKVSFGIKLDDFISQLKKEIQSRA